MGKSMVINRGNVACDNDFEKGFGVYPLVCKDTCGSQNILMGHTVHNPGARNQEHVHNGCEVQWFISSGHSLHYSCTVDHEEYKETECFPGTVGWVAPGEIHVGMNLNADLIGDCIFCYAGTNTIEGAKTVFYQDADVVEEYMRKRGKKLEDVLSLGKEALGKIEIDDEGNTVVK